MRGDDGIGPIDWRFLFGRRGPSVDKLYPSNVSGKWKSVHEEWTISRGSEEVKESYDYGDTPTEQSAYLRLASSAFDILEKTKSSSVDLAYYDRFSPINPKTQSRVLTEMTATLKVLGGGASWKVLSYGGDRLEVYYDRFERLLFLF